ncbi:MAG: GTP cyclohydrolase, FolE2/MptA family [Ignisphaera sp.]
MNSSGVPPDVQSSKPLYSIPIDQVGVKGVYRRVCIGGSRGSTCLDTYIDILVDLPKAQRGIHVSRNIEAALDVFSIIEYASFTSLEEAIESLCRELLTRHSYASYAEAKLSTTFLYEYRDSDLDLKENIPVKLSIKSRVSRGDSSVHRKLCIEVIGMTVCPCALQLCSYTLNTVGYAPSHTQRAKLKICISTVNSFIDVAELIEIALNSFSIPVFSYLKRDKECKMILKGFGNAKFAEDVVRTALYGLYERFGRKLAPDSMVYISIRSFESIHPFDLFVATRYSMGELANYLSAG